MPVELFGPVWWLEVCESADMTGDTGGRGQWVGIHELVASSDLSGDGFGVLDRVDMAGRRRFRHHV